MEDKLGQAILKQFEVTDDTMLDCGTRYVSVRYNPENREGDQFAMHMTFQQRAGNSEHNPFTLVDADSSEVDKDTRRKVAQPPVSLVRFLYALTEEHLANGSGRAAEFIETFLKKQDFSDEALGELADDLVEDYVSGGRT